MMNRALLLSLGRRRLVGGGGVSILHITRRAGGDNTTQQRLVRWSTSQAAVDEDEPKADTPTARFANLKRIVKPFLLKCHPDMSSTVSAKKVNLEAVQNLHGYLEVVRSRLVNDRRPATQQDKILELDFVLTLDKITGVKKPKEPALSRRRVEIVYPPDSIHTIPQIYGHSRRELLKLLKVANLEAPNDSSIYGDELLNEIFDDHKTENPNSGKSAYEISRDRFVRNIQWQNYDKLYKKAWADMEADRATEHLLRKHPGRRRKYIANVLSRVRMVEPLETLEQLVTFRRLSLLFEEHFFDLELEDYGNFWETHGRIILGPPRRNNSASALYRRNEGGFLFTLHPDMTVTIEIPVDFRDEEFFKELDANIWHFYGLVERDGFEDLIPSSYL